MRSRREHGPRPGERVELALGAIAARRCIHRICGVGSLRAGAGSRRKRDLAEGARRSLRRREDRNGAGRHRARDAAAGGRRRDRSGRDPRRVSPIPGALHRPHLAADRQQPFADRRGVRVHARNRPRRDRDAHSRRAVHVRPRGCQDERWQAVHGRQLRQGVGRLLGTRRQGRRRRPGVAGQDANPRRRHECLREARARAADDQPSERLGSRDGPGDANVRAAAFRPPGRRQLQGQTGHGSRGSRTWRSTSR